MGDTDVDHGQRHGENKLLRRENISLKIRRVFLRC